MTHIGVAVIEGAAAARDGCIDFLGNQHRADRLIAGAQTFGKQQQIRRNAFLLAGMQCAGASHAAHHLIENQQNVVAIANLPNALEIARAPRATAPRVAPTTGSAMKAATFSAPTRRIASCKFVGDSIAVVAVRLAGLLAAVRKAGRNMRHLLQQRQIGFAPRGMSAHRQRPQGIAVIAEAARNEVMTLRPGRIRHGIGAQASVRLPWPLSLPSRTRRGSSRRGA